MTQLESCLRTLGHIARQEALSATPKPHVSIRQHTSAYVRIRQHTSAYVSIRPHTPAYVSIRQDTSAYVRIRQNTSEYTSAYTLAYVSVHQHT